MRDSVCRARLGGHPSILVVSLGLVRMGYQAEGSERDHYRLDMVVRGMDIGQAHNPPVDGAHMVDYSMHRGVLQVIWRSHG